MDNSIEFIVGKESEGKKLREFLRGNAQLSTRLIRGAAMDGRIKIKDKSVKLNHVLKGGDKITIIISKEESQDIVPESMELDIVYEDTDILVVNKPPFIVVHPTRSHPIGTLANGILHYFVEKDENCIVRLVSRLDMNTSGLIIIAKNQFSHMSLAKEMSKDEFEKGYLAIIHGNMDEKEGTIDLPIYRPTEDVIKRVVDSRGQGSITHYKVVERLKNADLVELKLETGRTHQIRVHLSHLGHPIFGDTLYGSEDEAYIKRQALHAYKLRFPNPRTGKIINLEADIPNDMKELIHNLRL
jgi:23S rRNA pseudouridine1911/1915/1917 synthase